MNKWLAIGLFVLVAVTGCKPGSYVAQDGSVKSTYIHQYGVEVADEKEWQERGSSGQIIKQLKNGVTLSQNWHDGKLNGLSTWSFSHSNITHLEVFYDKGAKVWLQANYPSGMPRKQITYRHGNKSLVSTWYEDGSPRSSEEYDNDSLVSGDYFTRDQELESQVLEGNGERLNRDSLGQLISKSEFDKGQCVLEIVYYPNGMPKKYIPYVDGQIQGYLKTFLADGEPDTIEEWQAGRQNGKTSVFRSAERTALVPYVNGQKEGKELRFRPGTDIITQEVSWKNDLMHGPTVLYIDNNKVTEYYYKGDKVSKVEFHELEGADKITH